MKTPTHERTRSHANEKICRAGFDRIVNATRVHTYIGGRVSLRLPLAEPCQRPLNLSFRSLIVNAPR